MSIPAAADLDGRNRSRDVVDLPITTWLTLNRDSRRLDVRTRFDNRARDHRLRVMLPSDIDTDVAHAASAYDVVERPIQWMQTGDNHEGHYPFKPMQGFVDVSDGDAGLAFLSRGLREYEVVDDPRRTLAITLMRAHRAYMRANRGKMTPEELDACQGQHSLGVHEMSYAILPHADNWRKARIAQAAEEFNTPWRIIQGVVKPGDLPASQSLLTIEPTKSVQLSAFYQRAEGDYILRIYNLADKSVEAKIETVLPISAMRKVSMDEQRELALIEAKDGAWPIELGRKEIATLRIKLAENG
jgi:mannosylglycerate hydrolase